MRKLGRSALPLFFTILFASASWAQSSDDLKLCVDNSQTNPDAGIRYCTLAIQSAGLTPESLAIAYYRRGVAYFAKLDYDHALGDYDQSIQLNPNFAQVFNNRGAIFNDRGNFDRAIQDYDQAIRMNPNYALAIYNRANAYKGKGEFDRAIQDFDQSIRLNPNYAPAFNNRGNAYYGKGEFDRAIKDYDQAIRMNLNYTAAYDNRGLAYKHKGDSDRAITDFDQAIRLDPGSPLIFFHRGQAQFSSGQYDLALRDFASAHQIQPKDVYTIIWMYLAQARSGDNHQTELQKNVAEMDLTKWPAIVANLYLGGATPESVLAAAADPDPKKEKSHYCEANFFLAERALLTGNRLEAVSLLQKALDTGATLNFEYWAAKDELRKLDSTSRH
jgi:lipoprotein NlpI